MKRSLARDGKERGGAVVEFALCCLVTMPLLLGTTAIGLALVREIEVTQVCRDSGHMYANGVDFLQSASQTLLTTIGGSLGIGPKQTNSAVILTTITYVTQSNCDSANIKGACTNANTYVITRQIQIGGVGVIPSRFGTPPASDMADAQGNVAQNAYLTDSSDQTISPFPSTASSSFLSSFQQGNQFAYASEVTVIDHSLDWTGFIGSKAAASSLF